MPFKRYNIDLLNLEPLLLFGIGVFYIAMYPKPIHFHNKGGLMN